MHIITLDGETDFDGWRKAARALALNDVKPSDVTWHVAGDAPELFAPTAPSASQASASAAVRNAASVSAARTVTSNRGSRPNSQSPLIDSAPDSISEKSCRTQTSGRRGDTLPARLAMNPVAAAL